MITALGLGTKQAPENVNLDPQRQFWSWLKLWRNPDETGDSFHHERGWLSGFGTAQTDPAGMSVQIGGTSTIDCAQLWVMGSNGKTMPVLLSTDGTPEVVTIPTAPASGSRIDTIVIYVDKSSPDPESETPGTPEYVHTLVVSGTAASSPSAPTDAQIVSALPAGANQRYYPVAQVRVSANQTTITNSNITNLNPASPNLYWTTSDINSLALAQARTVSPRFASRQNITTNSWTAPSNGIVYFIGNVDTTKYASSITVSIAGTQVWRTVWNVDAQNYNWDASGNILVRQGDKVTFATNNGGQWSSRIFVPIN